MTQSHEIVIDIDMMKTARLVRKILSVAMRKSKTPSELYMACHLLLIDMERDFNMHLDDDAKQFLIWYKSKEASDIK